MTIRPIHALLLLALGAGELAQGALTITGASAGFIIVNNATVGQSYSAQLAVTGGVGPYNWTVVGTPPPGGLLFDSTGTLSGIPNSPVSRTTYFQAQVSDSSSPAQTASTLVGIKINPAPLVILTTSLPSTVVGLAVNQTVQASGGVTGYTWNLTNPACLNGSGLSFTSQSSSNTGNFSGVAAVAGTLDCTVQVTDQASSTAFQRLPIVVNPNVSITTGATLPATPAGQSYSVTLAATGGTGGPYSWTVPQSSTLPAGLVLDSQGVLHGSVASVGTYSFALQASDNVSRPAQFTASLQVYTPLSISTTSLPNAIQGNPYTQTLTGAGGSGSYTWSLTGNGLNGTGLALDAAGNLTGRPTASGQITFTAHLSDQAGNQKDKTLTLTVNPVLSISSVATLPVASTGVNYSFAFVAQGGTLGPYTFSLATGSTTPPGLSLTSAGVLQGIPNGAGTWNFTVLANDSVSPAARQTATLVTYLPLSFPAPSLPAAIQGVPYHQTLAAGNGYGSYTWTVSGSGLNGTGLTLGSDGTLSGAPATAVGISFTARVTDQAGNQLSQTVNLSIRPSLAISASPAAPVGSVGLPYSFQLTVTPGTGAPQAAIQWLAPVNALPNWLTLTSTGLLQGTPAAAGTYTFPVTASDGISATATFNVSILITPPLAISQVALPNALRDALYAPITLTATGGSNSAANLTWSATGLPPGMTLSPAGVLSGTPGTGGAFPRIAVSVTDSVTGQTAQATFSLQVSIPALIGVPPHSTEVLQGQSFSIALTANGGTTPYTWSLDSGALPPGVSVVSTGAVSGASGVAGNYTASVKVADSGGLTSTVSVPILVLGIASPGANLSGSVNAFFSAAYSGVGGTPPYTYSATGLPAGLSVSSNGVVSGFPTTAGASTIVVQVRDAAGFAISTSSSLTVSLGNPLSLSGLSTPDGKVNTSYSQTFTATGGNPPYSWSVVGGTLPTGLSLSSGGQLSGVPVQAGAFAFRVQVADSTGGSANAAASLNIQPAQLQITSGSLPSGVQGTDYPQQILSASGGIAPYTFSVTAGALPAGMTLNNGTIGGTPSGAGTSTFTVTVHDSANAAANAGFTVTIVPPALNLILSAGSLSFSASGGTGELPPAQSVGVQSSVVSQPVPYTVTISAGANWLNVSGGATTPGAVQVSPTDAALALPAGAYHAVVSIACASDLCATKTPQQVAVDLTVTSPAPALSVKTSVLAFSSSPGSAPAGQSLILQNSGGGALGVSSIRCEASWCSAGGNGSIPGGATAAFPVSVNPAGLAAGFYQTSVDIASSAGPASAPVTLFVATTANMSLVPGGTQFSAPAGSMPGNPSGSFLVSVSGGSSLEWSAAVTAGGDWLQLGASGGAATPTNPGVVSFSISPAAVSLTPQTYYGNITVTVPGAVNSPQIFLVVLNIGATTDPIRPDPEPAGLLFLSSGSTAVAPQTVQVFASSTVAVPWSAAASTTDGGAWLSVTPSVGNTSASSPGVSTVSVNPAGLPAGIYRGGVNYALSGSGVRTVNVTLIVQGSTAQAVPAARTSGEISRAACAGSALAPTQTGLVNNFSAPTSWPTILSIKLVTDCGAPVANGQVVATFSNGDPPLPLVTADTTSGVYSGTWIPRKSSGQVTVQARAAAPGFATATTQIIGAVVPNSAPVLTPHGTLHSFAPKLGAPLAPGTIAQIYGDNLASQTSVATSIPLPTNIGGTTVLIGGIAAPLYFVSAGQINAQIPFELDPNRQYQIVVQANNALTTPDMLQMTSAIPGLAAFADGGLIAQHADGSLVSKTAPAKPGEYIVAYLAGMGDTDNPVVTGAASPSAPLARPASTPALTLDGKSVQILFAGLTPGLVGLYQMNFQIPAAVAAGDLPLVVTQNGVASNPTVISVQP